MTGLPMVALAMAVWILPSSDANADADFAKLRLKEMSDYMTSQTALSFDYEATLEVVTTEDQKLELASSGAAVLNRPDKIRATRHGGSANVEMIFDGTTMTMFGPDVNLYTQFAVPGSIDHLIDTLRDQHGLVLPAADLLLANPYDELMAGVTDVKDIGSGVFGEVECDHFAFRTEGVDWQIWIAQGDRPYPCRYVITTKDMAHSPQYSIGVSNWRTGDEVVADDFAFDNSTNAEMTALGDLPASDLPENFTKGDGE
ncbi:MAG: DUF2092 domain-containing protein [Rhodospirillaceae bacterium]|nr:DUF2092 domain-containing protein [Rhodospirillaceae bacterium]